MIEGSKWTCRFLQYSIVESTILSQLDRQVAIEDQESDELEDRSER
jgi:hypothetical protein